MDHYVARGANVMQTITDRLLKAGAIMFVSWVVLDLMARVSGGMQHVTLD
jgi:hypothetical protein